MFQMDSMRRLAAGELSEIVGPVALESDRDRGVSACAASRADLRGASPADKSIFAAYARGVNAYIESHRGRYGVEFTVLGYDPRPWSAVDSIPDRPAYVPHARERLETQADETADAERRGTG